ncbi:MAG: hypothetical protein IJS28_12080 [Synergistaceae bacterium]|nr:hypothetical protein [Synergistaceae bacterium]
MKRTRKYIAALAVLAAGSVFYGSVPAHAKGIELDKVEVVFKRNETEARGHMPPPPDYGPGRHMPPPPEYGPRGHVPPPPDYGPRGHMPPPQPRPGDRRGFAPEPGGHMPPPPHEPRGHMPPPPPRW